MTNADLSIDLSATLAPFQDRLTTRRLTLRRQLLRDVAAELTGVLDLSAPLVVADPITWEVAGAATAASLERAGHAPTRFIIEPDEGAPWPIADEARVEALRQHLVAARPSAVIAVGAGTINDIAKMAAFKAGLPYAVVATAPSMNGYTSAIAALLTEGVKTTQPCTPPLACLADLDVMAQAPWRMIASGLGDLLSKPVSNADWRLSHRLIGSTWSADAMVLIEAGGALLEGVAHRLPERDVEAIGRLTGTLCLSGLAMSVAGSSSPASGAEHLISHYLDMTHFALGEPHDFHGCQVGVGTITTAAMYQLLADLDPATIDPDACVRRRPTWEAWEQELRRRFGPLFEAVLPHARAAWSDDATLRARLTHLKDEWASILADASASLRTPGSLREELLAAHCPVTFAEIGVTDERARRSIVYAPDIRARYTILHLAAELGTLDAWADAILRDHHGVPTP